MLVVISIVGGIEVPVCETHLEINSKSILFKINLIEVLVCETGKVIYFFCFRNIAVLGLVIPWTVSTIIFFTYRCPIHPGEGALIEEVC